jgi:uncharacterized protein YndB with AHSA1/START domain
MSDQTTRSEQKLNVEVTRVLDAPVEQVWKAWSEPAYVMQWWGPAGFTSPSAELDFREGGTSLVCMRAPAEFGGQDMYNTWTYRKIEPYRYIEFILHFSDPHKNPLDPAQMGMEPGIPNGVRHVITFTPTADNRTEMTITEYGYTTQQAHDLSKMGLEQCLDKMEAIYKP